MENLLRKLSSLTGDSDRSPGGVRCYRDDKTEIPRKNKKPTLINQFPVVLHYIQEVLEQI